MDNGPGSGENIVRYAIFLNRADEDNKLLTELHDVQRTCLSLAQDLTTDYIWQRGTFSLQVQTEEEILYLAGSTDYGDCVEDEWLVVYILRQLSTLDSRLWIRIWEEGGEFLLIEAAGVLPDWITPDVDQNRAWIHQGKLLLIPPQPGHPSQHLTLLSALRAIKSDDPSPVHSSPVETGAFSRLDGYPGRIQESAHHALAKIPRTLAYLLHSHPNTVARASEAFYLRDPVGLGRLFSQNYKPLFVTRDLVTVSVRLTRVLYAQLKSQQFTLPSSWKEPMGRQNCSAKEDAQDAAFDLGVKLTVGFELLVVNSADCDVPIAGTTFTRQGLKSLDCEPLPSDDEIRNWKDASRNDDDSWMHVTLEDLDDVIGAGDGNTGKKSGGAQAVSSQPEIQEMVSRIAKFLNDETAGPEGAEVGETDPDGHAPSTDDDDDSEEEEKGEDEEVDFDEARFNRLMREVLGSPGTQDSRGGPGDGGGLSADDSEDEEKQLMHELGVELQSHCGLEGGGDRAKLATVPEEGGAGEARDSRPAAGRPAEGSPIDGDEASQVDVDYNLARNLLESFKGQAGLPGPAGNILAMLGLQLPRDDDTDGEEGASNCIK